jgi:hypothetical protein
MDLQEVNGIKHDNSLVKLNNSVSKWTYKYQYLHVQKGKVDIEF